MFDHRTWNEYKAGFGTLETEFWIGKCSPLDATFLKLSELFNTISSSLRAFQNELQLKKHDFTFRIHENYKINVAH